MTPPRLTACVMIAVLGLAAAAAAGVRQSVDVSGAWLLTVEMSMGVASPSVDLKQNGDRISGIYVSRYGDYPVSGTIAGRTIRFSIKMRADDPVTITYTGEVSADGRRMNGTADLAEMGSATWTAGRTP